MTTHIGMVARYAAMREPQGKWAPKVIRFGVDCDEPHCHITTCGATQQEAEQRLAEHRERSHG